MADASFPISLEELAPFDEFQNLGLAEFESLQPTEKALRLAREQKALEEEQASLPLSKAALQLALGTGEAGKGALRQSIGGVITSMPYTGLLDIIPAYRQGRKEFGRAVSELGAENIQEATELGEQLGGGAPGRFIRELGTTFTASAPAIPAGLLGGLPLAAATAAGTQQGASFNQYKQFYQSRGLSEQEAEQRALLPSMIGGAITGTLTRIIPGGTEMLLSKFATGELTRAGLSGLIKQAVKEVALEIPEEGLDQIGQGVTEKLLVNPDKPVQDIIDETLFAMFAAGALAGTTAGGLTTIGKTAQAVARPIERGRRLRRLEAYRESPERQRELERAGERVEREDITSQIMAEGQRRTRRIGEPSYATTQRQEPVRDIVQRPTPDEERQAAEASRGYRDVAGGPITTTQEETPVLTSPDEPVLPLRTGTKGTDWEDQRGRPVRLVPAPERGPGMQKWAVVPEETPVAVPPAPEQKIAPVQFLQVQEGMPELVWYKLTGDITDPLGNVYPAGRNISNGELRRFGYTVPESELAKSAPAPVAPPSDIQVIGQVTPERQPLLDEVLARIREENANAPGLPIRRVELIKAPAGVGIVSTQPGRAMFDTVALDLDQLAASGVDRNLYLAAAINEEIIHNAGGRALQEEWSRSDQSIPFNDYWSGRMDAIAGEMTPAQHSRVREVYGRDLNDRVAAAEFVRMLVQERMRGQITEETLGRNTIQYLKQILRRLLDALRTATGTSRQNLQQHVNAIEDILRGQQQIRTVEEQQQVGLTDDEITRLGAASINPKQNELLKNFYESANRVASRTEYGQRVETPDRKSYVATWSNGSKRWNLSIPYRTEAAPDPYDVAAREEFRRRFPRGRPNFLSAGEGVNLDSNQILIPANSLRDAGLIAQYLPVLPTDVYSAENNPLLQIREGASEEDIRTALERYADIREAGPIKPDIVAAVDRFMDAIRSPEQTESPFDRMRRESGAEPPHELTPEQQRAREINERIRGRRPETLSAASPKTQEEMDRELAVKEAEEEGWVKHRALGVDDWVLARDMWTPQEIARSRKQAEETFTNAGIPHTWNEESQYYDIQPGATVESQYRLLELVKEAMRRQNWPAEPEVAALINSITANAKLGKTDYFDSFVRRQLYKLTRSEASHRGALLGALSHFAKDIREVSLRVEEILERTWADAYGGPAVEKVAEDLAGSVQKKAQDPAVVQKVLDKAPELTQAGVDAGLIGQIFQMPFFTQAELKERFIAAVVKKTRVTPAGATKLWNVFKEKFDPIRRELGRLALAEVKSLLRPDQRHLIKKPIWQKIQSMVDAGEFDAGHILKIIATEKGWRTPTQEEIKKLRQLARREQELRTLNEKERAEVDKYSPVHPPTPEAFEKARLEKEKKTEQHRNSILKEMDTRWARFTRPISLNPLTWLGLRHNTASAGLELIAANLLATIGFPFRLSISVASQILPHMTLTPIAYSWQQHEGTLDTLEGQKNFIRDAYLGLGDSIGAYLKSLKPAAYAARAAFLGRGEQRNVLRLTSSIAAFDRIRLKAQEEFEKGNVAKAYALKFLGMLDIGFRAARALDAFQTLPAETAEMYHQIRLEMGNQGKSLTEIKNNQYTIMDRIFREWMQAIADTKKGLADAGVADATEAQIKEIAGTLIRQRQYQKANELKLSGDDWQRINRLTKSTLAWNEAETKGAGGVIGGALKRIQRGVSKGLGIPTDIGVFSNAIATAINRQLHFTPFYHILGGGRGEGSPWFATEIDRKRRALDALAGTGFGSIAVALVLMGIIKVQLPRRMDDDEKEKFIAEGHRFGTVEFQYGDTFVPVSMNNSPLWIVAPYLAGAGAFMDLQERRQKEQEKLNAEAAKKGLPPGQIRPMDPGDMAGVAAQAAWQTIFGSRTFSGFLGSVASYGEKLNTRRIIAGRIAPMIPGLPAVREVVSRMGGVTLNDKLASTWDYLLPLQSSQAAMVNKLGDPVRTPSDLQRVIQVLSGGNYGPVTKQKTQAYQTLYGSEFKPPTISPNKGYQFPDSYRPMNDKELSRYSILRGRYFQEGLAGVAAGDEAAVKSAYQQAERRALTEVGVQVPAATTRETTTARRATAIRGPRRLRTRAGSRLRRPRIRRLSYRRPRLAVRRPRLRRVRRLAA